MKTRTAASTPRSAGITLTEILISILILGVGLVSLATLFPIGLLRLREAQRQTRSAYLFQSATADVAARGLLNSNSFIVRRSAATPRTGSPWYYSVMSRHARIQPTDPGHARIRRPTPFAVNPDARPHISVGAAAASSGGYGLPFAYDPLWRYYRPGILSRPDRPDHCPRPDSRRDHSDQQRVELLTAAGPVGQRPRQRLWLAAAHELQPADDDARRPSWCPPSSSLPRTWSGKSPPTPTTRWPSWAVAVGTPSTVVPDLSIAHEQPGPADVSAHQRLAVLLDDHGPAEQLGQRRRVRGEHRRLREPAVLDRQWRGGRRDRGRRRVRGQQQRLAPQATGRATAPAPTGPCCCAGTQPSPTPSSRSATGSPTSPTSASQKLVHSRFYSAYNGPGGVPNPLNNGEWDNLPAQRCFWYQVQKVTPAQSDPTLRAATFRSMTVYVNRTLDAKTLLERATATPWS